MHLRARPASIATAVLLGLASSSAASAQSVADFYRGKTVIYNLAASDGASYGLYGRTFVEHLRKHIPGNPTIVMQVMPGGGGVAGANHVFNVAAKDGTVIGTPLTTAMMLAATDPNAVLYDPRKYSWIGSMAVIQDVITVWHTAPAKTLNEAKRIELIMGSSGKGSNTFQDVALANNLLGTKFQPVRGYKGGAEINLAMERGEVQGRANTWEGWVSSNPDWLRDKKLVHLVQLGPRKLAEIGDEVPLFRDLVAEGEPRQIVDFIGANLAMGRAVYAPPGIPKDRLEALRAAFVATMKDPAYIAQATKLKLDADTWQTGEAVERIVNEAFSLSPALIQKAKAAMDLP